MSPSTAAGGWTDLLRPAGPAAPAARVVVFPHAGGAPLRYRGPLSPLPDDVELIGVTLPGRERRAAEPLLTCAAEAVDGVWRELRRLPPAPTVLYGHSMGGLLAVAIADLACSEPVGSAPNCDAVVVSCAPPGAPTPVRLEDALAQHGLPTDALGDGGTDGADGAVLDRNARVLAHDLALSVQALAAMRGVRLTVPLTALAGRDDPLVPAGTLPGWAAFTQAAHRQRLVPGGHFFPFSPTGTDALLAELTAALHGAVTATGRLAAPRA